MHRIVAAMTFTDGSTGYVDAYFNIKNGVQTTPTAASAIAEAPVVIMENSTSTVVEYSESPNTIPWALFGVSCGAIVILAITLVVVNKRPTSGERV